MRDANQLESHEWDWLEPELRWFNENLTVPDDLGKIGAERVICWFKPTAKEAIERARAIAALLDEKGVSTRMLKTATLGEIIYEDDVQVAAFPRRPQKHLRRR